MLEGVPRKGPRAHPCAASPSAPTILWSLDLARMAEDKLNLNGGPPPLKASEQMPVLLVNLKMKMSETTALVGLGPEGRSHHLFQAFLNHDYL